MGHLIASDGCPLVYLDEGDPSKPLLILLHGFTGSSKVWMVNYPAFWSKYRVIMPDFRGHGGSGKSPHGYHVSRLAQDFRELLESLCPKSDARPDIATLGPIAALGASLGCAVLWSYAELYTTKHFSHMIFVDQSPLQNSTLDGWDSRYCSRGMNSAEAVINLQYTLSVEPTYAYKNTIDVCLAYRSHPQLTDNVTDATRRDDDRFFLEEAQKCDPRWLGKLMADHTALDWRDSITAMFGRYSGSETKVLVMASTRSGCFPAEGPMKVVELINTPNTEFELTSHVGRARRAQQFKDLCFTALTEQAAWDPSKDTSTKLVPPPPPGGFPVPRRETPPPEVETPLAEGIIFDDGGHWCYWESPKLFNQRVLEFLAK